MVAVEALLIGEEAAANQGNLHGGEVAGVDGAIEGVVLKLEVEGCSGMVNTSSPSQPPPGGVETRAAAPTAGRPRMRSSSDSNGDGYCIRLRAAPLESTLPAYLGNEPGQHPAIPNVGTTNRASGRTRPFYKYVHRTKPRHQEALGRAALSRITRRRITVCRLRRSVAPP